MWDDIVLLFLRFLSELKIKINIKKIKYEIRKFQMPINSLKYFKNFTEYSV